MARISCSGCRCAVIFIITKSNTLNGSFIAGTVSLIRSSVPSLEIAAEFLHNGTFRNVWTTWTDSAVIYMVYNLVSGSKFVSAVVVYKLAVNRPSSWYINPVTETGEWQHTITAQLYSGKEPVADSHAAYWWQVKEENGDWRDITAEDEELWLTCKSNGVFTKNLTFDARMFKTASFRVTAAYYEDTRPGNPAKSYLQCDTTVIVMVPGTLRVAQRQTRGGKVASDFSTEEGFELTAHDNRREYDDAMTDSMLQIRWKGKSAKAGSSETFIDSGRSVNFIPKDKGFDSAYPVAVWAEASVYAKHKVLTDDSGKVVTDDSGKIVIVPIYE